MSYITSLIISLISTALLLGINVIQLVKAIKLENSKRIANISDLKKFLDKPLEGIWEMRGEFEKYHGNTARYVSSGFATFSWNESTEKYDVWYAYSTQKENDNTDLVTAICSGSASSKKNGNIGREIKMTMHIDGRTSADGVNANSRTFEFVSKNIIIQSDKAIEIEIPFCSGDKKTEGVIHFRR